MNPALQYFIGLSDFDPEYQFDFTLLSKYRQKIGIDVAKEMMNKLLQHHQIVPNEKVECTINSGSISIDASVIPVNITYPTDLKLLNALREETEKIIDELYEKSSLEKKPRTYRKKARNEFLEYAKKRRPRREVRFNGNRKQLQYVRRNIETIEKTAGFVLNVEQQERMNTIKMIYEQQYYMWENKTNRVENRIVNLHQAHVRGIVRGKAGVNIEFGPKIAVSKIAGYIYLDKISFNNFNESETLEKIVNDYRNRFGFYPESIRADKIYQTKKNKQICKDLGIRLSGTPLGKTKRTMSEQEKSEMKIDNRKIQDIKGVFGVAKTKYGLSNLMSKMPDSQKASIGMVFFVMNLMQILRKTSFSSKIEMHIFNVKRNNTRYIFENEDVYYQ
jgi:hypothetical protein